MNPLTEESESVWPEQKHRKQPYVRQEYPLSDGSARIIAAAQEVHHTIGPGFKEVFYQRAMAMELPAQGLLLNFGAKSLEIRRLVNG